MIHERHTAPGASNNRVLLVMLPGAGSTAADFAANGLVDALHACDLTVDVIAAQPELEHYLDGDAAGELHREIIAPALAQGYQRIWLLGISLGGMGALLYARQFPNQVEGLVLIAPFLGTKGTIAELVAAGGLAAWSPESSGATAPEQRMLLWLRAFVAEPRAAPALYLGYGTEDRFAPGHIMLAKLLPDARTVTAPGGHDWKTWAQLWRLVLGLAPIATAQAPEK